MKKHIPGEELAQYYATTITPMGAARENLDGPKYIISIICLPLCQFTERSYCYKWMNMVTSSKHYTISCVSRKVCPPKCFKQTRSLQGSTNKLQPFPLNPAELPINRLMTKLEYVLEYVLMLLQQAKFCRCISAHRGLPHQKRNGKLAMYE